MVDFPLENLLENVTIPYSHTILCSPTSRELQIFGSDKTYTDIKTSEALGEIIEAINDGKEALNLKDTIRGVRNFVFGCTEINMKAHEEKLKGTDTLQVTIEKIVREL